MKSLLSFVAAGMALAGLSASAPASVDTTPKPGGVYRLKPGTYVQSSVACGSAPNAAVRRYDGRGISGANTRACRARILSRRGNRYAVEQSCIEAGAGPAPRASERQTITITDALTFTLRTNGSGTTYRFCPAYMLPAALREVRK